MPSPGEDGAWLARALHDLCQPLTALECRLYLATLPDGQGSEHDPAQLRAAIDDGLHECERLMQHVRTLQDRARTAQV